MLLNAGGLGARDVRGDTPADVAEALGFRDIAMTCREAAVREVERRGTTSHQQQCILWGTNQGGG